VAADSAGSEFKPGLAASRSSTRRVFRPAERRSRENGARDRAGELDDPHA
jgi:hypothetical protein